MQSLTGLLTVFAAAAGLVSAQTGASSRTVWGGVYTEAQAARGATAFGQSCAGCHALAAQGKAPLVGDPFWKSFSQKTVGELLDYVSTYMPNGTPGSLNAAVYQDIVAEMLKSNGFPAGSAELARDTSAAVRIVPRDGHAGLPADALVRVVGCLAPSGPEVAKAGANWMVTNATTPERAERPSPPEGDAARRLGNRTMPLKFVLTNLDSLAGSRVVVNGLLIGDDGVDGINVTTVSPVASKCP